MQHSKEVDDVQVPACLLACSLLYVAQVNSACSSLPVLPTFLCRSKIQSLKAPLCLYARQHASAKGAVRMQNIDPNLLLTSFLPILLFAGAVALEWHTVRRLLSSSLLLAGKHC